MLLVGQGKVGKTSLVKRLLDGSFDLHEGKTEGINITQWNVGVDGKDVQLNVWDFGGQEIMHATHQFFLTKRSLYVLVLDARLGEDENRIEYWLKIIQSFGDESPVIIVGNQIDEHPLDINRAGLQDKYPTIKAFVETSCLNGQGIDDLKAVITREIGALPNIHDELLNTWFTVKTRLEEMKENYISQEKYREMCEAEGITNPLSQRTLLGFLHDLGIILNFRDDPRLEETNILNPEWVTNGVYKILNDRDVFENKGILDRARLKDILDRKQYPRSKHLFIMDMMRKFELCYDLEGRRDEQFLIPDLLPRDEPYTGQWDGALAFEYHYNVLPGSIITRLIVRMHTYIHQHTSWRTGVVLASRDNTALVKADKEDKKIFIRIIGPEAGLRPLLAIIRSQFDAIHDTISRIEADEKVPLPGRPETVVDYEHLLTLEAMGKVTFVPEGLREEVNVKQLLDGVESERERLKRRESLRGEDKPVFRREPPPPEPVASEEGKLKKYLDRKSEKETKHGLWIYFGALSAILAGLAILTIKFGWDTMEPWTYFIGGAATLGSYAYFAITQKKLSPEAI